MTTRTKTLAGASLVLALALTGCNGTAGNGGQHHLRCLQQHLPGSDGDQFFRERLPEFLRECDELAACFFGVCGVLVVGAVVRAGHVPAAQG